MLLLLRFCFRHQICGRRLRPKSLFVPVVAVVVEIDFSLLTFELNLIVLLGVMALKKLVSSIHWEHLMLLKLLLV